MNPYQQLLRSGGPWIVFGGILLLAFWIRIQGVGTIPDGQFTGNDLYRYYWQAQMVTEQGRLPARDMHRWLPLGRDLGQSLNAYPYAIAYTYKAIAILFPRVSLYHVALFAPTVCFVLGVGVLCLFLYRAFGGLFASIAGVLLATLIIFALDAVDGYIVRKQNQTSVFGGVFDIAGDRIVENVFWIYFAVNGQIPVWIPVIVVSRSFLIDGVRSVTLKHGKTAFGENTMMRAGWARALTASRATRGTYNFAKAFTFLYLAGVNLFKHADFHFKRIDHLERAGIILSVVTVALCLIRGLPVVIDGWHYLTPKQQDF